MAHLRHRTPYTARSPETRELFNSLSKSELFDIAMYLAALCTDSYDEALGMNGGRGAAVRLAYEARALADNGIIPKRKRDGIVLTLSSEWRDCCDAA